MRCYRKILHISYKDHVTNEEVRAKIQQAIGPHEDLLPLVKRRKLQWYGHVSRSSGLAKTILQRTVEEGGKQGRGRGGKTTSGNGQALNSPSPRGQWRTGKKMEETGCQIIFGAPTTLAVKGLMMMTGDTSVRRNIGTRIHRHVPDQLGLQATDENQCYPVMTQAEVQHTHTKKNVYF